MEAQWLLLRTLMETRLTGVNLICCSWTRFFFNGASGDDETDDPIIHELLELSLLKYASNTPLGLPGTDEYFRLWVWEKIVPWLFDDIDTSVMNLEQSSMFSCYYLWKLGYAFMWKGFWISKWRTTSHTLLILRRFRSWFW